MKSSTKFAIAVWFLMFFVIVVDGTLSYEITESSAFGYGRIIVSAIAVFGWFLADAKENGIDPSPLLRIAVVAVSFIAVPYYRFRYMGRNAASYSWRKLLGVSVP